MSVGRFSRHLLCEEVIDSKGRLFLADRSRYLYRDLPDSRYHLVREGDTLHQLADTYYEGVGIDDAPNLFWVIADFQPVPIHDPTLKLQPGTLLVIPSLRVVLEEILNPSRVAEFTG